MRWPSPKTEFSKNVLTLMTGTSLAQAIPIAMSPILTRLYSPDDFGVFASYSAILAIISSVSTARYELAIMIPDKEEAALAIVKIGFFIALALSLTSFWVIHFFHSTILKALDNEALGPWLYVLPIGILLTGTYQVLNYWVNRQKGFRPLALSRVSQSGSNAGVSVGAGWLEFGVGGLVFGGLFGRFSACLMLLRRFLIDLKSMNLSVSRELIWQQLKDHRKFPLYDVPTVLTNLTANQAPNILLSTLFGPAFSGFYYLTQRILQVPITLISTSVLDVFKEEAARNYRKQGEAKQVYLKTLKSLSLMAIIPSILLFIFAVPLFRFVFGDEWSVAGEFAQILIPALAFRFVANPLSFMLYIAEFQRVNLFLMVLLLASILSSLYFSSSSHVAIGWISASYVIFYSLHLIVSAHLAGVFRDS